MATNKKKNSSSEEKSSVPMVHLQEKVAKSRETISKLQESKNKLQQEDRQLHEQGRKLIKPIDDQIDKVKISISNTEKKLISEEKALISLFEKASLALSHAEIEELKKLSQSYQAFGSHMASTPKEKAGTYQAQEVCPWNACWTCTTTCGGCTGCGQACSQLNACIGRPSA